MYSKEQLTWDMFAKWNSLEADLHNLSFQPLGFGHCFGEMFYPPQKQHRKNVRFHESLWEMFSGNGCVYIYIYYIYIIDISLPPRKKKQQLSRSPKKLQNSCFFPFPFGDQLQSIKKVEVLHSLIDQVAHGMFGVVKIIMKRPGCGCKTKNMAGQPTPPNVPPSEIRPYYGLINHWFPLIRPY